MEHAALSFVQWAGGDALKGAWRWVIQPDREEYDLAELGPTSFSLGDRQFVRKDLQLESTQGHTLECSHFLPATDPGERLPCVVYLHGSGSTRLESLWAVPRLLERNVSVFAFDFAGCGHSAGKYVSLGHHEERDLGVVLRHLRRSGAVSSIALWGRSMGAAAAVLRASKDHSLAACVLDSAFADLQTVCMELVDQAAVPVPRLLAGAALRAVREEVEARAGFDMCALAPALAAPRARCPALLACARSDGLVLPHHAEDLKCAWGGQSSVVVLDGGHNDLRPDEFLIQAANFLAEQLQADSSRAPLERAVTPTAGATAAPVPEPGSASPGAEQRAAAEAPPRRISRRARRATWRKWVSRGHQPRKHQSA